MVGTSLKERVKLFSLGIRVGGTFEKRRSRFFASPPANEMNWRGLSQVGFAVFHSK